MMIAVLSLATSIAMADDAAVLSGYRLTNKAFRAAAQKVLPALVTIETFGGVARPKTGRRGGGISRPGDGPTTGLIVSPDGWIVTSTFNFVKKPPIITVILDDDSRHVAKLMGRDETQRICLLKIDGVKDLPTANFIPREKARVGQWAISVGIGYGDDDPAISAGIISATTRIFGKAIQTDANISPANYGGPLIDIDGGVIGVCVPLSPQSRSALAGVEWYDSGIGFVVPLHGQEKLLEQLKTGKEFHPGLIGIATKTATPKGQGAAIAAVAPKSPASKELKKGDRLLEVNGQKVIDVIHLKTILGRFYAGETITLKIGRGKKKLDVQITLAEKVEPIKRKKGRLKIKKIEAE
jgi:serine protease Do